LSLASTERGSGPPVVLLASLGRSTADFDSLVEPLLAAGRRVVAIEGHGVGTSPLPPSGADLHDLAKDVASSMEGLAGPALVVGHAFGNRLARCLATDHPHLVAGLVLLGAGGKVGPDNEAQGALARCFRRDLSERERLEAVATAFFAPGSDPSPWRDGWWPEAARVQSAATQATATDDWWLPPAPIEVWAAVGAQDRISPPANAQMLVEALGERGHLRIIEGAGHALLPEQPDAVLEVILGACRQTEGRRVL